MERQAHPVPPLLAAVEGAHHRFVEKLARLQVACRDAAGPAVDAGNQIELLEVHAAERAQGRAHFLRRSVARRFRRGAGGVQTWSI